MLRLSHIAFILAALAISGCEEKKPEKTAQPIEFESEKAGYALILPLGWKLESAEKLNTFADLAASYEDTHYLIVIPQQLPVIPGVEAPDALALKRASIAVMEEEIEDFSIDKQGPVKLAGRVAQSVFARGIVEGREVTYVTTYATRDGWGYQIVGWGPAERESTLVSQIDRVLATWTFEESNESAPQDAGTTDKKPDHDTGISYDVGDSTTEK